MNEMMIKGISQLVGSIILLLASGWCFLWMFASSDLAFSACNGEFSLFHDRFRCRQPYIALILWVSFGVASVTLFYFGLKNLRNARGSEKNT